MVWRRQLLVCVGGLLAVALLTGGCTDPAKSSATADGTKSASSPSPSPSTLYSLPDLDLCEKTDLTPIKDLYHEKGVVEPDQAVGHEACVFRMYRRPEQSLVQLEVKVWAFPSISEAAHKYNSRRDFDDLALDLDKGSAGIGDESFRKVGRRPIGSHSLLGLREENVYVEVSLEINNDETPQSELHPKVLEIAESTLEAAKAG